MTGKSLLDLAFDVISEKGDENLPISFHDLWEEVSLRGNLAIEQIRGKIGRFYTDLSLDGRFVTLPNNFWDLRVHHTFDKVHIDMNEVYSDLDASDELDEEELEYLNPERIVKGTAIGEEGEDEDEEKED